MEELTFWEGMFEQRRVNLEDNARKKSVRKTHNKNPAGSKLERRFARRNKARVKFDK